MIQNQAINKIIATQDKNFIIENNLDITLFSDYKEEFQWILDYMDKYDSIPDRATFIGKFSDFQLLEVSVSNDYILDELYKDRETRILTDSYNDMRKLLLAGKIEEATALAQKTSENLIHSTSIEAVNLLEDESRFNEYVEKKNNISDYFVTTGLKELDAVIGGWDRKEEYATIVARTNSGKSWLLLKAAIEAAKKGLVVGLYSGEMTPSKVGYRMDTLTSHISNSGLVRGRDEVFNDYKEYITNEMHNIKGKLWVISPKELGGIATVNTLRAFIKKYNLDMLCVDQHSLLEDQRGAKNPVDRASNISKDLKNLQVLTGIPIITVSQQNRTSTENGIDTTHIAQSDRIGQDSTTVIAFEQKDGVLTLSLIKARDSAAGTKLQYAIDFDKGDFKFIPEDESAEEALTEEFGDEPF